MATVSYDLSSANSGFDATGTATSVSLALLNAVAVGDAIVVGFTWQSAATVSSITDSLGNTYSATADVTFTNPVQSTTAVIWSCLSVTNAGTPTITIHLSGGATGTLNDYAAVRLTSTSGPIALGNTASNHASTGTSATTAAVANPAGACAIEWTGNNSGNYTAGGSFTALETGVSDCFAGQNLASAGTVGANAVVSPNGDWAIGLAVYTPQPGPIVGESDVVFTTSATPSGAGALVGASAVRFNAALYVPQHVKLGDWDRTAYPITWFDGTEDSGGWWDYVDIPLGPPGAIIGSSGVVFTTSGTLAGAGALAGESDVVFATSPTLAGAGALAGSSAVVFAASATPALQGTATVVFSATAVPALQGAANVVFTASATPTITGASNVIFAAAGTLLGAGALAGESDVVFAAAGTMIGLTAAVGSSAVVFTATATLGGQGALAGTSATVFATSATPALQAAANAVFAAHVTAAGAGALTGESDAVFAASGTLAGTGAVAGTSAAVFTARATPSGGTATLGTAAETVGHPVQSATGTFTEGSAFAWMGPGPGDKQPRIRRFRTAADVAREQAEEELEQGLPPAPPAEERQDETPPAYIGPLVFKGEGRSTLIAPPVTQAGYGTIGLTGAAAQRPAASLSQQAAGSTLFEGTARQAPHSDKPELLARADAADATIGELRAEVARKNDEVRGLEVSLHDARAQFEAERKAWDARRLAERHDAEALSAKESADRAALAEAERRDSAAREAALSAEIEALRADRTQADIDSAAAAAGAEQVRASIQTQLEAAREQIAALTQAIADGDARAQTASLEAEASDRRIVTMVDALTRAAAAKDARIAALESELAEERARPAPPPVVHEVEVVRLVEVESPAQAAQIALLGEKLVAAQASLERAQETLEVLRGRTTADAARLRRAIADAKAMAASETSRADAARAEVAELEALLVDAQNRPPEIRLVGDPALRAENERLTARLVALMNTAAPAPEVVTVDRIVTISVEDSTRVERLQAELEETRAKEKRARRQAARMYVALLHDAVMQKASKADSEIAKFSASLSTPRKVS